MTSAPANQSLKSTLTPTTIDEVCAAVQTQPRLLPVGARTKPALSPATLPHLEMTGLADIVEYDPAEFTITAQAGARLATIQALLQENGQHMPFDPPLIAAGATLGGTIAAGVSGSGRQRFGSLRDFLIGVRFIDGQARLIRGGGKVVKNAAGFDLPKLMVGSRGRFGVLIEASLKVFPEPPAYGTLVHALPDMAQAAAAITQLARSQFDLYALDLTRGDANAANAQQPAPGYVLTARLGGMQSTILPRLENLRAMVGGGELLEAGPEEERIWQTRRELGWSDGCPWLVKSACTPRHARELEHRLAAAGLEIRRVYTHALNSVWLAGDAPLAEFDRALSGCEMGGVVLRTPDGDTANTTDSTTGESTEHGAAIHSPAIGRSVETEFHARVRATLDPAGRFYAFDEA